MPVFGMNNGMIPIVAYNYGACKPDRIKKTIGLAMTYAVCIMLVGLLVFQNKTEVLLELFDASPQMMALGMPALREISWSFLFAGICIICSSSFQALGKGFYSLALSFIRQLVVLLPAAYILSLSGNVNFVWWSFPIAEMAAIVISVIFMLRVNKTILKPLRGMQVEEK